MTTDSAPFAAVPSLRLARRLTVTPAGVRLGALAVLSTLFAAVVWHRGWPQDYFSIFAWMWLLTIAWRVDARPRTHLVFVRDWWGPLALLTLYFWSREIADNLGMPTHYTWPIRFDEMVGFGDTPTARLQAALCGTPCDPTTAAHWYDTFFFFIWVSHFTIGLSVAVIFWLRNRQEFRAWMRRYLGLNALAVVCYVLLPTAPPWMASAEGRLPSEVYRLSARAWVGPRPEGVGAANPTDWAGNAVAAMPSLHAGVAFLIALYAIQRFSSPYRWLLLLYPLAMSFALVYLGEHYVADVLGGALCAAGVLAACTRWERRRDRRRDRQRATVAVAERELVDA